MSFRVQCSENYYGPDCTTFCEPMEGVYTCDSEGRPICLQGNQRFCIQCLSSLRPSPSCAACLNPSTNCTTCQSRNLDPSTSCTTCIAGHILDPQTNCTECVLGYDPASNCTTRLSNMGSNCSVAMGTTEETETIDSTEVTAMYMETLDSIGEVYSTRGS